MFAGTLETLQSFWKTTSDTFCFRPKYGTPGVRGALGPEHICCFQDCCSAGVAGAGPLVVWGAGGRRGLAGCTSRNSAICGRTKTYKAVGAWFFPRILGLSNVPGRGVIAFRLGSGTRLTGGLILRLAAARDFLFTIPAIDVHPVPLFRSGKEA